MNQAQILGALRTILPAVLMYAVGKGWISQSEVADLAAAVATLVATGFSVWNHTEANTVAAANDLPGVAGVITKHTAEGVALANSVPSSTVAPAGTIAAAEMVKP